MRDLKFSQRVTRDFPLKFPLWLISFETRSRDIKIDSWDTNFLPFFLVSRPLISSDQMILFYFSVKRDKIGMVRDR